MAERVASWVRHKWGPDAVVADFAPMPGNSGISFGFDVARGGETLASLVIRLAPVGVKRRGNTDVLRQVPLLQALERASVPMAPLVWWTDDGAWFGTDAIVQRKLDGQPLHMHEPNSGVEPIDGDTDPYIEAAARVLAAIHAVDWKATLPGWDEPQTISQQVEFWVRLLERVNDRDVVAAGARTAELVLATEPPEHTVGLFHGDYQTHNILYDRHRPHIHAVVDWEIAGIGPVGVDLGWLSVMTDASFWHPARRDRMRIHADPVRLRGWYEDASAPGCAHFDWYRAFAAFRYGAIAAFNLHLHHSGRRVDPVNELMGPGAPFLFARANELIS